VLIFDDSDQFESYTIATLGRSSSFSGLKRRAGTNRAFLAGVLCYNVYSGDANACNQAPEDIEKRLTSGEAHRRTKTYYAREAVLAHIEISKTRIWPKPLWRTSRRPQQNVSLESAMKKHGLEG